MAEEQTQTATPEATAAAAIDAEIAASQAPASSPETAETTTEAPQAEGNAETGAETTPETAEPTLTPQQVQAAKHVGLSDDEIKALSPLEAKMVERYSAATRRAESLAGRLQQQAKPEAKPQATPAPAQPAAPAELQEPPAITDEDDADAIATKANAIREYSLGIGKRMQALEQQLAGLGSAAEQASKQKATDEANSFFQSLDAEIYPQFGRGNILDLDTNSPEAAERGKLLRVAAKVMEAREELGEQTTAKECMEAALAIVAPESFKKAVQKPLQEAAAQRQSRGSARPSGNHRQEQTVTDEQRAAQEVVAEASKRGIAIPL